MTDPMDDIIAALSTFEPSRDETDNLARLYEIFSDFALLPQRSRAMPAMFSLLERVPDAELGSPGPLVHELEAISGYLALLRDSLHRQPTYYTVWMINRFLNTDLPDDQRELWLSELQAAFAHPLTSAQIRTAAERFLADQKGNARLR